MKRLTKRYIITTLDNLELSDPLRYERYYISDNLRIQKKGDVLEKEIIDNNNIIIRKEKINLEEFNTLKEKAYSRIIRDSYLYLKDNRVSIKKYYDNYLGFIRVEVKFSSLDEMNNYKKEDWIGIDITNTKLAFDKDLSKLSKNDFSKEFNKIMSNNR